MNSQERANDIYAKAARGELCMDEEGHLASSLKESDYKRAMRLIKLPEFRCFGELMAHESAEAGYSVAQTGEFDKYLLWMLEIYDLLDGFRASCGPAPVEV